MFIPILPYTSLSFTSNQYNLNAGFGQGEIDEPGNDRLFSYLPLLKTHSNQEQKNAIHPPPHPESIEELFQ